MQMAQTPLHVSAGYNKAEIVKFLLDWQGPDKVELEARNMVGKMFSFWIRILSHTNCFEIQFKTC